MKTTNATTLSSRVLKLNVGFLLSAGPGNHKDVQMDISDPVRISDDLVASYISGSLRLTRTKEGILVQTDLKVALNRECARCLELFSNEIPVQVEELYAHPQPIDEAEFFVGQDAKLDLAPLLRAEVLIELSHREYCQKACKGLCVHCGANLNFEDCNCEVDTIDPRLAKLRQLLDTGD